MDVRHVTASRAAYDELSQVTAHIGAIEVEDENEQEMDLLVNGVRFDVDMQAEDDNIDEDDHDNDTTVPRLQAAAEPNKRQKVDEDVWKKNLATASSQYIVNTTRHEYERLWQKFVAFCVEHTFVKSDTSFLEACEAGNIPADTPTWIGFWIMKKCDKLDPETGDINPLDARASYSTAQKMRAALSHKFGRDYGQEDHAWTESHFQRGMYTGNPSISPIVSRYMCSLRRTKVHDGELSVSATAISEETLKKLYTLNFDESLYPNDLVRDPRPRKRKAAGRWDAARSLRIMLNLIYVLAYLCLLRFDEVLRVEWHWLDLHQLPDSSHRLKISLPFRKTHQTGGIAPFFLYSNQEKPWLCPILALSWWTRCTQHLSGFVFRRRLAHTFSQQPEDNMSADSFIQCFRNNLLDVGVNPRSYGTHSFRRGGCQYLAMTLRWPIRDICTWGGWAENFDSPGTVFKYILSLVDEPSIAREDYFNPQREAAERCGRCGRACWCSRY